MVIIGISLYGITTSSGNGTENNFIEKNDNRVTSGMQIIENMVCLILTFVSFLDDWYENGLPVVSPSEYARLTYEEACLRESVISARKVCL